MFYSIFCFVGYPKNVIISQDVSDLFSDLNYIDKKVTENLGESLFKGVFKI